MLLSLLESVVVPQTRPSSNPVGFIGIGRVVLN
jgi:hypothetical protein